MKYVNLAVVAATLTLAACATQTSYAPAKNADAYGYYSSDLSDNRYRVIFNGNSSTGPNTVKDFALLRAAELTLQDGHDWFQIVNREIEKERISRRQEHTTTQTGRVVERDCGLLGCTTRSRPAMTTSIAVDSGTTRQRYSSSLEVVAGNYPMPSQSGDYYDARKLASTLRGAM